MTTEAVKTYTTPHRPKGFGVGPFGPVGTVLLVILAFVIVLAIPSLGIVTALVLGLFGGGALLLLVVKDRYHRSFLDRIGARIGFRSAVKNRTNEYLPGTLTVLGSHRLPGVLSESTLHRWTDKNGTPFTILQYPKDRQFVVNISAEPDGSSLIDPDDLEKQVEKHGDWIANLAFESVDLLQASVCLESTSDSGPALTLEMENNQSPNASPLARQWASQVTSTYPVGATATRSYITLTFKAPSPEFDLDGNKIKGQNPVEAIGRLIADRLPHLLEDLPETGAGVVSAMTDDEVIEAVRCAYNPEDRKVYDILASKGEQAPVTLWNSVGPSGAKAMWDHYRHSGGASITWETSGFITNEVISKVLLPILEPSKDVAVKRITFLYQPIDPALAGAMAEHDHRTAEGRVINAKKPSATQARQVNEANQTRQHTANGHALVNFAILVTATVLDLNKLSAARAAIAHQGPTARLILRQMNGVQDSAFAQGLGPLGLVTYKHLAIPTSLSQGV